MLQGRVFITGDKHGQLHTVTRFCEKVGTTIDDTLIILGDVGLNLYGEKSDRALKTYASKLPITLFCIRGNHEARPSDFGYYKLKWFDKYSCFCYWDSNYPNILFPKDGTCWINNYRCLICGGAYSVDKEYRLENEWFWNPSEQLSEKEKTDLILSVSQSPNYDYVFSHTAPLSLEPTWLFIPSIDQSKVDKSMEKFLQTIYDKIEKTSTFKKWFFGHYHYDCNINDKAILLYDSFIELE